tara:strand:- start:816 stop:1295 length:480 start_codon:yes stop_codon:yes gene_type:complete
LERSVALYSTYKSSPSSKESMSGYLRTIFSFFTPKFVSADSESLAERILNKEVIKTINECGELRYIEVIKQVEQSKERLEILEAKCQRLHSFATRINPRRKLKLKVLRDLLQRVKNGQNYGASTIIVDELYQEYEELDRILRGSASKSFTNLNSALYMS